MDPIIWNLLEEIRICICNALDEQTQCLCPCRSCVVFGVPAWDNCECGFLYVRATRVYPFENFPSVASGPITCSVQLAIDIEIGILRCAPGIKENGDPPTCEEISDAALISYEDAYVATAAVICCLAEQKKSRQFVFRDTRPVGPRGGCQGVELNLTVMLNA